MTDHVMHSEFYVMDEETAKIINDTRDAGGDIWAVGTTATRTLETIADEIGHCPRTVPAGQRSLSIRATASRRSII
ncbi:MAG: S-adenosylmethionine:tRNA ribosyltransferase-isomerase [Butyricicoccaceae bacterium]